MPYVVRVLNRVCFLSAVRDSAIPISQQDFATWSVRCSKLNMISKPQPLKTCHLTVNLSKCSAV